MDWWSLPQVSVKKRLVLLSFGKTPSLAAEQRKRLKFAVYMAHAPLTNNPCALWHRQSCWLCYSLAAACSECAFYNSYVLAAISYTDNISSFFDQTNSKFHK